MTTPRATRAVASLIELEPRILYSADPFTAVVGLQPLQAELRLLDPITAAAPATAPLQRAAPIELRTDEQPAALVVIDSGVAGWQTLAADIGSARAGGRPVEVLVLDATRDGVAQISEALAGRSGLAALHIVSHGSDALLRLGTTTLGADTLESHAAQIAAWRNALDEGADLLLYGCDVAGSAAGRGFVARLGALTGADVAASTDLSGSAAFGGNWTLEYTTGAIEAALGASAFGDWEGVLATPPGTALFRDASSTVPLATRWDGSAFGTAGATALSGGWKIIAAAEAPTRNELIALGVDNANAISAIRWDGSTWSKLKHADGNVLTGAASASFHHAFDVVYEHTSGRALLVWDSGASTPTYAVWDGNTLSNPAKVPVATASEPVTIRLAASPKAGSNEVVLAVIGADKASEVIVWDGSSWANGQALRSGTPSIAVAYEQTSGNALVVYAAGASTGTLYRSWNGSNWSGEGALAAPAGVTAAVHWTAVAADASAGSNRIAVGYATDSSTPQYWFAVWDGSSWNAAHTLLASSSGIDPTFTNVAVAFEHDSGRLLAAYAEASKTTVTYRTWTAGGGWSAALAGPSVGVSNSLALYAAPLGNDIMLGAQNASSALSSVQWNGSSWGAPTQLSANTTQTKNQPFVFVWDQVPNTAPVLVLSDGALAYVENDAPRVIDAAATVSDADSADLIGGTLTVSFGANGAAEDRLSVRHEGDAPGQIGVSGSTVRYGGTIIGTVSGGNGLTPLVVSFTTAAATPVAAQALLRNVSYANASEDPSTLVRSVRFVITDGDGGASTAATRGVTVAAVNDAPVLAAIESAPLVHVEKGAPTAVTATLTVSDVDSAVLTGARVQISANHRSDQDALGFATRGAIGGVWSAATGTLTLSGSDSVANYQAALRSVTYTNSSANPSTLARTVGFTVSDGAVESAVVTRTVTVTAVNDPPTIANLAGDFRAYLPGAGAVVIDQGAAALVSDVDSPNFSGGALTVRVASGGVAAQDVLAIRNQGNGAGQIGVAGSTVSHGGTALGTWSGGSGGTPLTVSFNGNATAANVSALVANITYQNAAGTAATPGLRTLRFVLNDGGVGGSSVDHDAWVNVGPTVRDNFNVEAYNNNDGTAAWASDWMESEVAGAAGPTAGEIKVSTGGGNGQLQVTTVNLNDHIVRAANLAGATSATLSYVYDASFLDQAGAVAVQISKDGGATYTTLRNHVAGGGAGTESFDVSAHASASTQLRVIVTGVRGMGSLLRLDNIQIAYTPNAAPVLDAAKSPSLAAVSEDAGAPVGAVGTLVSALVDAGGANDNVYDADGGARYGIAVVDAHTASGSWFYSTNNGSSWSALGNVSDASRRLLAADAQTRLYFRPTADFSGLIDAAITFRAWDQSQGAANGSLDASNASGGTTPFSVATDTASLLVQPVNDAPVLSGANAMASINRNPSANPGTLVADLIAGRLVDADGEGSLRGIAVTGAVTTNGVWQHTSNGGATWTTFTAPSAASATLLAADLATFVRFVPNANYSGTVSNGLSFRGWDRSSDAVGTPANTTANGGTSAYSTAIASTSILVTAGNSAPVLSGANDLAAVLEDQTGGAGTLVSTLIAGRTSDADPGAVAGIAVTGLDATRGSWQYTLDGSTWQNFSTPSVASALLLAADATTAVRFTPAADYAGTVAPGITFRAWDRSSGLAGSMADTGGLAGTYLDQFTTAAYTNDDGTLPWSGAWTEVDGMGGGAASGRISIAGGNLVWQVASAGNSLTRGANLAGAQSAVLSFNYDSVLGNGAELHVQAWDAASSTFKTLTGGVFDGVSNTGVGSVALDLTPYATANTQVRLYVVGGNTGSAKNALTIDNFQIQTAARNGGSTAYSVATASAGVTVNPVNDAPVRTGGAPAAISVSEDSANGSSVPLGLGSLAYGAGGGADEAGQTLSYRLTGVPAAITVYNGAAVVSAGTALTLGELRGLSYRTVPDANGVGLLTWTVQDSGGVDGNGNGVDTLTETLSITVQPVNDAPTLADARLAPVYQGAVNPAGQRIGDVFDGGFADPDVGASLAGIAVVGNTANAAQGVWQYTSNAGTDWRAIGAVNDSTGALALSRTAWLRFLPASGFVGTPAELLLRALDNSHTGATSATGATETRVLVSTSVRGGSSAVAAVATRLTTSVGAAPTMAPVLHGANAMTAIDEDADGNAGTLVSALIAGQVTSASTLLGIAVTAVDNSQGVWQYSRDGGARWTAFGTPTQATARLLAADGDTRVRLVPNADWNGTLFAGLTFHAWDRSSGTVGDTAQVVPGSSNLTVRDDFSTIAYSNNDGPQNWSGPWSEFEPSSTPGPTGGAVRIKNGVAVIDTNLAGPALWRSVDLSKSSAAVLHFSYAAGNATSGSFDVQVSRDGGASYKPLATYANASGAVSLDLSAHVGGMATIRFRSLGGGSDSQAEFQIDFVEVRATSPFSAASAATSIDVRAINDAPTLANGATVVLPATNEDAVSSTATVDALLSGASWADVDAGAVKGIAITSQIGNGAWQYSTDGVSWSGFGNVSATHALLLASGTQLRYQPDAANGETATLAYRAWDRTSGAASTNAAPAYADPAGGGGTTAYSSGSATATLSVTPVNDAPTLANGATVVLPATNEDAVSSTAMVDALLSGASWADGDAGAVKGIAITSQIGNGAWQYSTDGVSWSGFGNVSATHALLLASGTQLRYQPDAANGETAMLAYRAWDRTSGAASTNAAPAYADPAGGGGTTAYSSGSATATLSVTPVNDAPTLVDGTVIAMAATDEDTPSAATTIGAFLAAAGWHDADHAAPGGIGVTAVAGLGSWEYSADGDVWRAIATATPAQALLLDATASLRYVPDGRNGETARVDFVAWDRSTGQASTATPSFGDTRSAGGTSAYSVATVTLRLEVRPVNDAPTGALRLTGAAVEDGVLRVDASDVTDADGLGPFAYQWLRNDRVVVGATSDSYRLDDIDVGARIAVVATYTDGWGTVEVLQSTATTPVVNVNDIPSGRPHVIGDAVENTVLRAETASIADADGLGAFSYQWLRDGVAVDGATTDRYSLGNADVGRSLSVRVAYVDGHGSSEALTSAPTAAVLNVNDAPSGSPRIVGEAIENTVLRAETASIADADGLGAFSYQWLRDGVAVDGATSDRYVLGNADVGRSLSVRVAYVDGHGSSEALTSAPTAAVLNVNDAPSGSPRIVGEAIENTVLRAETASIADADGLGAFSYQWLRDGVAVDGATTVFYSLGNADVGRSLSVRVAYVDGHGSSEALTSAPTAAVLNVNDAPSGSPRIVGEAIENTVLRAETASIADADGLGAFSYQWLRDGVAVDGATTDRHTLGNADVGRSLSVRVAYVDGHGSSEALTSAPTAAVLNVNDAPSGSPRIVGEAIENTVLRAETASIADADGLGAFSYQWLRDGVAVDGATSDRYVLGNADVGRSLSVRVAYVDGHGSSEALTSAPTAAVLNVNDAPSGSPRIVGEAIENTVLRAETASIADADGLGAFSYQWLRDGVAVDGATSDRYVLGNADVGRSLSVRVAYVDGHGSSEALTSAPTAAVLNVNDAPSGSPRIVGEAIENTVLRAETASIADADGLGAFSYQWLRDGVAVDGATTVFYSLGNADVGRSLSVRVAYVDGHGSSEALTSAPTAAVLNVNDAPSGSPRIVGEAIENTVLRAETASIADADGLGAFSYQWLRDGVAVDGATSDRHTLGNADVGRSLSVRVAYVDGHGSSEALTSAPTAAVLNVNDAPSGSPRIVGEAIENTVLRAETASIADADGLGAFSYQWLRDGVAVDGATTVFYSLGNADVGRSLSVRVAYVDGHGSSEALTSAPTAAVLNVNDAPSGSPRIVGEAIENTVLRAETASIADADGLGAFSYQWLRDGVAVDGATSDRYVLGNADVGRSLSVRVAYVDGHGSSEALTSAPTAAVLNVNDAPSGSPRIVGEAIENTVLRAETASIADADGLGAFSYQWLRDGVAVDGATTVFYSLGNADVGRSLSVRVAYVDGHGSSEALTSAPTAAVLNVNDAPSGSPRIVGDAIENTVLRAETASIADADGLGAFSYQWLRDGVAVDGATSDRHTLGNADVGRSLSVRVAYVDGHGSSEALTSAPTAAVLNVNDAPSGSPRIVGEAIENTVLRAETASIADADGLGAFSYQWLRDGVAVDGATSDRHTLGNADVGRSLSVRVAYVDGHGSSEALTSAPTAAVLNVNDAPSGSPRIVGEAIENTVLRAETASIADADGLGAFSYQWLRDGVAVDGATSDRHTLGNADVGRSLSVRVAYVDGHGSSEALTSAPTAAVLNVNDAPSGSPRIVGEAIENTVLRAETASIADADGLGAFSYQWLRDGVAVDGATSDRYVLGNADVGRSLSVRVAYVDGHGSSEALTSAPTAAVLNVNDAPSGSPRIVGEAIENTVLRAETASIADADGLGAFSYQWLRDGVAVDGATSDRYVLGNADVGRSLSVRVAYVDGHGSSEALTSAPTAAVLNVNDAPSGSPRIVGEAIENTVLRAETASIADADGLGAFSYQWLRDGVAVDGATSDRYVLGNADVGRSLSVRVAYVDGHGSSEALTSAPTAAVAAVNDTPTGRPGVTGEARETELLHADASSIGDADGLGTFSYQWLRDGEPIEGATGDALRLAAADVGHVVTVAVAYTDGQGHAERLISASGTAVTAAPGTARIDGVAVENDTLRVALEAAQGAEAATVRYQWLRQGVAIEGATASSHTLAAADVGKAIGAVVSYERNGVTVSRQAAPTPAVAPQPVVAVGGTLTLSNAQTIVLTPQQLATLVAADGRQTLDVAATRALTYTITDVSNGRFELAAEPGVSVTTFTHADLSGGRVRFIHSVGSGAPSFQVQVSDNFGNTFSARTRIEFTPAPAPSLVFSAPDAAAVATPKTPVTTAVATTSVEAVAVAVRADAPRPFVEQVEVFGGGPSEAYALSGAATPRGAVSAMPTGRVELGDQMQMGDFSYQLVTFDLDARGGSRPQGVSTQSVTGEFGGQTEESRSYLSSEATRLAGVSLSAGAVWWALRVGGLFASLLASLPTWRQLDLLPVLRDASDDDTDWHKEDDDDDESARREEQALDQILGDVSTGSHR